MWNCLKDYVWDYIKMIWDELWYTGRVWEQGLMVKGLPGVPKALVGSPAWRWSGGLKHVLFYCKNMALTLLVMIFDVKVPMWSAEVGWWMTLAVWHSLKLLLMFWGYLKKNICHLHFRMEWHRISCITLQDTNLKHKLLLEFSI